MQEQQTQTNSLKTRQLIIGVFLDLLGMASYLIPGLGEFSDVIWAPISAFILAKMYPGKVGKVGALVNFVEELSPGLDIIPTFTLTWVYTYYFQKKSF
ncbi:hypothetical protein [Myroides odoratus]|uniref:Uncharacterized protein n=1 Tax=Myroides odoratus TaxID=256 RepID=A0A9Q7ECT4_MYROD|nr:hypothetical protein [Myroides odoratus]EHQ40995.1 hypothetical protein Myrod_0151 [Myroides odoratus DSM 2801]EKB08373.1 hypothetical protein HMPREF9716_01192 [Myroides odoratus CIP 103059]QQU01940.1 hypothetical protein I6I88_09425 [Myroides odoratus]WQD55768.1 hypothetical protein U0010_09550 [Myroides odoratus]STZ32029.1 Uncharacterised protein [Myroides odoratus]